MFFLLNAVDVAVARGATIFPHRWKDESAVEYATSLAPIWLMSLEPKSDGPSPRLRSVRFPARQARSSLRERCDPFALDWRVPTLAGCFRNAKVVAESAQLLGNRIAVIAAGSDGRTEACVRRLKTGSEP